MPERMPYDDLERLAREALRLVRYYRTRYHHDPGNEVDGYTPYHVVHGVHRDGMRYADVVLDAGRAAGFCDGEVTEWH